MLVLILYEQILLIIIQSIIKKKYYNFFFWHQIIYLNKIFQTAGQEFRGTNIAYDINCFYDDYNLWNHPA